MILAEAGVRTTASETTQSRSGAFEFTRHRAWVYSAPGQASSRMRQYTGQHGPRRDHAAPPWQSQSRVKFHRCTQFGTVDAEAPDCLYVFKALAVRSRRTHVGNLLHYAIVFLVVALVAAFLGFGGVAGTAMEGARLLFWVAIVLVVITAVVGFLRRA